MYYVMTHIFRDKITKVFQGALEDCIDYVDEDTDIYFIIDENNNIVKLQIKKGKNNNDSKRTYKYTSYI